jgi:hypothetical protein
VILFLAANPSGTDRLALDREARAIRAELRRSGYRDRFDFITASEDKTAQVWDAVTGKPLTSPLPHPAPVKSAAFSPDGTRAVTASLDNAAWVWGQRRVGVGRHHWQAAHRPPPASGCGEERRVQPRRIPRRHRERQDRADLGRSAR